MNRPQDISQEDIEVADSWGWSLADDLEKSRKRAWLVAAGFASLAILEAIALVLLLPLKTVEPYTLLVDRQTGYVEELAPLERQIIAPDAALTRSFLAQYVIARESYSPTDLERDYRKVALWTAGEERARYISSMQRSPGSRSAIPGGRVAVAIVSVSSLGANRSMVRFTTTDGGRAGETSPPQYWVAIIDWRFSGADMSEDDRLLNPLGFQVTRYRRDAETPPAPQIIEVPAEQIR